MRFCVYVDGSQMVGYECNEAQLSMGWNLITFCGDPKSIFLLNNFRENNEIAFCGENVNYLINCAKSCYENFDNDLRGGGGWNAGV